MSKDCFKVMAALENLLPWFSTADSYLTCKAAWLKPAYADLVSGMPILLRFLHGINATVTHFMLRVDGQLTTRAWSGELELTGYHQYVNDVRLTALNEIMPKLKALVEALKEECSEI